MSFQAARSTSTHCAKIRSSVASDRAVESRVAASWRRCTNYYGLDPASHSDRHVMTDHEVTEAGERTEHIRAHAVPALSRLTTLLSSYHVCAGFAAPQGVITDLLTPSHYQDDLRHWGLTRGVDWSEAREGTNAIGTCLFEEVPIVIQHDEHFFSRDTVLTCFAAPIVDHLGKNGGALNVSLSGRDMDNRAKSVILSLVHSTARQIEADHFHAVFARKRIVSLASSGRAGSVLLAIDKDDVICGATRSARAMFDLTDARLEHGICAVDLLEQVDDGLDNSERSVIRRALVRSNGNVSAAARSLGMSLATAKRRIKQYDLKGSADRDDKE